MEPYVFGIFFSWLYIRSDEKMGDEHELGSSFKIQAIGCPLSLVKVLVYGSSGRRARTVLHRFRDDPKYKLSSPIEP